MRLFNGPFEVQRNAFLDRPRFVLARDDVDVKAGQFLGLSDKVLAILRIAHGTGRHHMHLLHPVIPNRLSLGHQRIQSSGHSVGTDDPFGHHLGQA